MQRKSPPPEDSWESDAVWKLLDQSPMKTAGARFAEDTVRAARLAPVIKPWWSRLFTHDRSGFLGQPVAVAGHSGGGFGFPSGGCYPGHRGN
jgi:hypothetical protein